MDELDPSAQILGAVNVIGNEKGKLKGFNTDSKGFLRMLEETVIFRPEKAVVLGAGGAAKCVIYTLFEYGVGEIDFFSRSRERLELIKRRFGNFGSLTGHIWQTEDLELTTKQADLVINATPIGMFPFINDTPLHINYEARPGALAVDLIYNPRESKFLQSARKKGYRTQNGLNMLVYQGMEALKVWLKHFFYEEEFILGAKKLLQEALSKYS